MFIFIGNFDIFFFFISFLSLYVSLVKFDKIDKIVIEKFFLNCLLEF